MLTCIKNSIKIKGGSVLLFLLLASVGYAQQSFSYKALLDTNKILIGDQVAMRIFVTHSKHVQVSFPSYKDSIIPGIEVLADFPVDTANLGGEQISLSKVYLLTSFDTGAYTIPESKILILHTGAIADTVSTEALQLRVNTVAIDTTKADFKDIKPPIEAPITFSEIAPWLFGGIGFLALLALVTWFIIRKIQNKPLLSISRPNEPSDVMALRLLNNLKQEKLWQNKQVKLYHSKLTEILRTYIDQSLQINALEQTSEETLQDIAKHTDISADDQNKIRMIFTVADLTKFAKFTPSDTENEESMKLGEAFILNTKPTPIENKNSTVEQPSNNSNNQIKSGN